MLRAVQILACLSLVITGCSTGPRAERGSRAPDWRAADRTAPLPEGVEQVPEGPRLAPPPRFNPELAPAEARGAADAWISLVRWSRQNEVGPVRRLSSGAAPSYSLSASNGVFLLHPGSLLANWDGLELYLGFEPQLINGQPFVHGFDLRKNIEPLVQGSILPMKTNPVVVIDPGHGGQNTGATSVADGVPEKEFTLDWAKRLQAALEAEGWRVFLTRTGDVDLSLSNRVAFAEEHQADLFISLHFNSAAPSQEQSGLETYCLTPAGMPSTLKRGFEDDLSLVFTNNAFDAQNLQYAMRIHRALLAVVGSDRGVRRARFLGVLRGQDRPAILIEGGYLSNPGEARRIADPGYRQRLAEAVAEALRAEPGGVKPETNSLAATNAVRRGEASQRVSDALQPEDLRTHNATLH